MLGSMRDFTQNEFWRRRVLTAGSKFSLVAGVCTGSWMIAGFPVSFLSGNDYFQCRHGLVVWLCS